MNYGTDGNLYALDKHLRHQEQLEKIYDDEIEKFRGEMDEYVFDLANAFARYMKSDYIDKKEYIDILIQDLKEQL